MDLREFYIQNIHENEYHYQFYDFINDINMTHNFFNGDEKTKDYKFEVFDAKAAITKFKELCDPRRTTSFHNVDKCWFYLVTYYLHKSGYVIKEFPEVLKRPPEEPMDFTCKEIIRKIIKQNNEEDYGNITLEIRDIFISDLTFEIRCNSLEFNDSIRDMFSEISNRGAQFESMSTDEKLAEIVNMMEHLLKRDDHFITLDYSAVCFEYISDDDVKDYRRQLQCFRHANEGALEERKCFTEEQKSFLIDYGIMILNVIYPLVFENTDD